MADERSYTDDDIRAIVDRALQSQPGGAVNHADLLSIGAQVGLSREAIDQAARELAESRLDQQGARQIVGRRRRWLAAHAALFTVVHGLLFAINFLTTPGEWWVLFPLFIWGAALLLHSALVFAVPVSPARLQRERRDLERQRQAASRKRVPELTEPSAPTDVAEPLEANEPDPKRARP
jgi:2TM domain